MAVGNGKKANREMSMTTPLPAMTGAELRCIREFLGLSTAWLSEHMAINERRLLRMEKDEEPIPDALVSKLDDIAEETKAEVHRLTAVYRRKVKAAEDTVTMSTYRTDAEYGGSYPSRWHRMLSSRVVEAVPGLVLVYT